MERKLPLGRGACATVLVLGLVALAILFALLLLVRSPGRSGTSSTRCPGWSQDASNNSSLGSWVNEHSQVPETAQANVKEIAQGVATRPAA